MATRKSVMYELVKDEAKKLRKNATKSELKRLDFEELDTQSSIRCVYGQMTGDCYSNRAKDLIVNSCKRVYKDEYTKDLNNCRLNGKPNRNYRSVINTNNYFSPIEVFIDQPKNKTNGNNELLIKYLKGETKRLNFK